MMLPFEGYEIVKLVLIFLGSVPCIPTFPSVIPEFFCEATYSATDINTIDVRSSTSTLFVRYPQFVLSWEPARFGIVCSQSTCTYHYTLVYPNSSQVSFLKVYC